MKQSLIAQLKSYLHQHAKITREELWQVSKGYCQSTAERKMRYLVEWNYCEPLNKDGARANGINDFVKAWRRNYAG